MVFQCFDQTNLILCIEIISIIIISFFQFTLNSAVPASVISNLDVPNFDNETLNFHHGHGIDIGNDLGDFIESFIRNSNETRKLLHVELPEIYPFIPPPPEAFMSSAQLIKHYGYPVENHTVRTEDGYYLTLFRIPHGRSWTNNNNNALSKEPILFAHGLLGSSDDWVFHRTPSENLALMLSEAGHDIWLGNVRGNNYSLKHDSMTENDLDFWRFGVTEMGMYDAPAMINYILKVTQQKQLSYIGHSMGASVFFIAMETYPHLQGVVKKMFALAPAVYLSHAVAPIRIMTILMDRIFLAFQSIIAGGRVFPSFFNKGIHRFGPWLCLGRIPGVPCALLMGFFAGFDVSQLDNTTSSMIYGHAPSIGSAQTLVQFKHWMMTGRFEAYDHDSVVINYLTYNSTKPPSYNLRNIHVPVYIFNGPGDWLVVQKDVDQLVSELPNVKLSERVNYSAFAHLDFVYAKDAKILVYNRLVDLFLTN